eukprot:1447019-Rhodomonas_salina.1
MRIVWSSDAEQMYSELVDHAQSEIPWLCPTNLCMLSPVFASQSITVLSAEALARYFPQLENLTLATAFSCPSSLNFSL